jgi:3-hydroxyacyl-[acyl-carrier-protein] dehydratase
MSLSEILAAIPHRPPFLLIDEVVAHGDQSIVCRKTFQANEWFFQGHYPGYPIVPGVLMCEACMQAGAVLLSRVVDMATGMPVATRASDVKFKRMVRPGETVQIEVTLNERLADAFFMTGKVTCEGKLACRLDFAVAITPRVEANHPK